MLQQSKRLAWFVSSIVLAAAVLTAAPPAHAVELEPGGNVALSGVSGGPGPGSVLVDQSIPFQIHGAGGALLYDGILRDRVTRRDETLTLSFVRQIEGTDGRLNGLVKQLTCADFRSYLTDVDYSTTSIGTVTPETASRTSDGSRVTFDFGRTPVGNDEQSRFVHVNTEALDYADGGKCVITLETGESIALEVKQPIRFVEPGCRNIDFEDIPEHTQFPAGAAFASNGVLMQLEEFYWDVGSCTNPTPGNYARIEVRDLACRGGHELAVNNVNVSFEYQEPLIGWRVYFGEYGGNVNLQVNGQCVSVANFSDLPLYVGGAEVTVFEDQPGQGCGSLTLHGPIFEVSIGGQELWIDDVLCERDVCLADREPPVAELHAPANETCVCDPVEIVGTADDANFDYYVLDYRRTTDPTWHTIATANTPVAADVLGVWSAAGLPQGRYLIRLTAFDACGHGSTAVIVVWLGTEFDNLTLREPDNGDILGQRVCVDGTAWDNYCFDSYTVEYQPVGGAAWNPVDPSQPVYTGTVINDPIAHWDTVGLGVPDGDYLIRAQGVDDCGHEAEEVREVVVDNTWPEALITSPGPCEYVEGVVRVVGTAFDEHLANWTLQYTGGDASHWVTIANGSSNVLDDTLGAWDTTALRPCAYTLRLVVVDAAVLDCNGIKHHRSEYTVSVNVGACGDFDVDDDGDVDTYDYYWFEQAFTGPLP